MFALPPTLVLLINVFGIVFNEAIISGQLFVHISRLVGEGSALQVQEILNNFQNLNRNWIITILGTIFLMFVSSTLFTVIQNSINQLWSIRHRSTYGLGFGLNDRIISLLVLFFSGVLFMGALVADGFLAVIENFLQKYEHTISVLGLQIVNKIISLGLFTLWFAILFRYLPNARVGWRAIWTGAFLTAVLFLIGEVILGKLLIESNLKSIYGATASLVLLLLFIFYSSFIMYFGASFIRVFADYFGVPMLPKSYAIRYTITDIE